MKRWTALFTALVVAMATRSEVAAQSNNVPEWQDPLVFGRNKLPPRNSAWPCPDAKSGWTSRYEHSSPWVRSLDGDWTFHWSPDPSMLMVGLDSRRMRESSQLVSCTQCSTPSCFFTVASLRTAETS